MTLPATILKSQSLALAIKAATGESPIVTDYKNYSELSFNPDQVKRLQTKLKAAMSAAPGDVRINLVPVVVPVVLEKVLPLALVALGVAYFLGRKKVLF